MKNLSQATTDFEKKVSIRKSITYDETTMMTQNCWPVFSSKVQTILSVPISNDKVDFRLS